MVSMLFIVISSFAPVRSSSSGIARLQVKMFTGDETFTVSAGPGIGAREIVLEVWRTGPEAGTGNVEFDVDIMYNGLPSQVGTHHVTMYSGQTHLITYQQTPVVIGTDAWPVGDVYNVVYY